MSQRRRDSLAPFVASVEGIANTPAYRGLALAVFENLELAEFGNRIPFLTFEIFGSEALPTVAEIAEDASGGAIRCSSDHQVTGFAAYGQSADSALSALIDAFGVDVLDEGDAFRSPSEAEPVNVPDRDLGSWMDDEAAPKVEREQASAKTVPSGLRLSFYDPLTDFQAGEVRAVVDDEIGKEEQIELAAVLNRANAECANQLTLARRWAKRDTLTLRLPPRFADFAPGSKIKLSDDGEIWTAQRCTLEGFVIVVELRRTVPILKLAAPDPPATMRKMSSVTSQEPAMALALFETPIAIGLDATRSTLVFAASSSEPGWRRPLIEVRCKSHSLLVHGAPHKSILGRTRSVLQAGKPGLIDEEAWVEIELVDRDQWLTSCDDQALKEACNLAQIGGEVIQFGDATPLGDGQFRLSRLLRGLRGTEGATVHSKGDLFLLIDPKSLVPITLPDWSVGSIITARVATPAGLATTCWTLSDHTMHYHLSPLSN